MGVTCCDTNESYLQATGVFSMDASDDALIIAAQGGDHNAFVELCKRHSAVAKLKIFSIVKNHEDTEDVLQDTLLRAYLHLSTFRRCCKFSTWLTTIGMNSAFMVLRKRRIRREAQGSVISLETGTVETQEFVDRSAGPERIYLYKQELLLVRREVEKLGPSLRSVVSQHYGSDCSLEETSKAQGLSLAATKSRLMRGRARLRSSLTRYRISSARN
jgi:RNA polymerase sigma-70 factor, ECF subfamily